MTAPAVPQHLHDAHKIDGSAHLKLVLDDMVENWRAPFSPERVAAVNYLLYELYHTPESNYVPFYLMKFGQAYDRALGTNTFGGRDK